MTIKSTYVQYDHMIAPMLFVTPFVLQPIIMKLLSIVGHCSAMGCALKDKPSCSSLDLCADMHAYVAGVAATN